MQSSMSSDQALNLTIGVSPEHLVLKNTVKYKKENGDYNFFRKKYTVVGRNAFFLLKK